MDVVLGVVTTLTATNLCTSYWPVKQLHRSVVSGQGSGAVSVCLGG